MSSSDNTGRSRPLLVQPNPIHLFRIEETLAEIRQCLESGWTGLGYKTLELEDAWRRYTGLPHAHFLNSATAGLQLALRLLKERDGWADGDEIISTPLTFVATNHVILHERLRPVFAAVDEHLCLDPESIAARITHRTRAVMFVGLGGNTGRLEQVADLCRARGLRLILDASVRRGCGRPTSNRTGRAGGPSLPSSSKRSGTRSRASSLTPRIPTFDPGTRMWVNAGGVGTVWDGSLARPPFSRSDVRAVAELKLRAT